MKVSIDKAIRNAEAMLQMEGMQPSPEVLSDCKKVLSGELTHEQYIAKLQEQFMVAEDGGVQP